MRYFILQQDPFFSNRFSLEGWQGKINHKWINFQDFHKIPPRNVLTVTLKENVPFPDIVTAPFLLVSTMIMDVADMYGEPVYKRDVVVVDEQENQSKHYQLALLEAVGHGHILLGESNLFRMCIKDREEIVVSQDFAESILRRGAVGIMLQELYIEKEALYGK